MDSAPALAPPWQRLSWRVFTGTSALVLLLLALVLGVATVGARRAARNSARESLEQSADLVAQLLAGRGRSLGGGARVFVQGPYFRTLVAERRRDDILDQTFEAAEQLEASWVFITDDNGTLVAKSDEPSAYGEPMARVPLVSAALRGQVTTGFGGSGDSVLFQATAVPIAAPGGMPFGVLVATRVLDSLTAADIALATNHALLFFVLDADGHARVAATSLASDTALRSAVVYAVSDMPSVGANPHQDVTYAGRTWLLHRSTLATAGGTPVGGYVVLQAADDAVASLAPLRASLVWAAILGLLGAVVAARLTSKAVARPVAAMTKQVRQVVEQGGVLPGAAPAERVSVMYASAEVSELSAAVSALVTETNDQDIVRATLASFPVAESDTTIKAKSTRTFAFRSATARRGDWEPGVLIAQRYRLEAELSHGAIDRLFRARDVVRGRVVALRLLSDDQTARDERVAPGGRAVVPHDPGDPSVSHRHVVNVVDVGEADGVRFISSEFVDGCSVASLLSQRRMLDAAVVAAIARQLLRGVTALHAAGITHGRITSRDVLLSKTGVVKLDAWRCVRHVPPFTRAADDGGSMRRIGGARLSTTEYMAPELLIGGAPSPCADVYAIGVVLYECLTGHTPFATQTPVELLSTKLAHVASPRADGDVSSISPSVAMSLASAPNGGVGLPGSSPRYAELLGLLQHMIHPDPARRIDSAHRALEAWARVGRIAAIST